MNKIIKIGNKTISSTDPCFIIGELSCNHNQDYELAIKTIDAMYQSGVDCVKLQTAKPESITINCDNNFFKVKGGTLWDEKTFFQLYEEVHTPWDWHKPLKEYTESKGMIFFSSPFSNEAVDFLEELNVPAYKIASFEITDIPLIKYTASKGKPVIISTGIANRGDIEDALEACKSVGNEDIILLKCTSAYPTPLEDVNLNVLSTLKKDFDCLVGLSDHTIGFEVPLGAVSLGAKIIEKHFIMDRSIGGPDSAFSSEPHEFKQMISTVRNLELAMGTSEIHLSEKVEKNRQFARSLFVVSDIKEGEKFTDKNVRSIRPGYGMAPKYYEEILGKTATQDVMRGTPLTKEMIK